MPAQISALIIYFFKKPIIVAFLGLLLTDSYNLEA